MCLITESRELFVTFAVSEIIEVRDIVTYMYVMVSALGSRVAALCCCARHFTISVHCSDALAT